MDRPRDPKEIVRTGYDKASRAYREDSPDPGSRESRRYVAWIRDFSDLIPSGSRVLDLGCGCGVPADGLLSERFDVTGVDISPVQVERAEQLVPGATFICRDMTICEFQENSFAGIVSLYAIIHLPLEEQRPLLERMHLWLKPGGHLLITVGYSEWTGCEDDWLGVEGARMYWSHANRDTYAEWLREAGFQMIREGFVPEDKGGHTLFLSRKPA